MSYFPEIKGLTLVVGCVCCIAGALTILYGIVRGSIFLWHAIAHELAR